MGQAKGILMARRGCTPDAAFEALRKVSQHRNTKLRQIAEQVVYLGDLEE
ncbi:MAG TPA: ANTAR domain-containing protein [Acidimicrobiia bacterium]|nr:ANTAR domain-containing protein [Acidimicrobiia bacterium]